MTPLTLLVDQLSSQIAETFGLDMTDPETAQFIRSYAYSTLEDRAVGISLALQYAANAIEGSAMLMDPATRVIYGPGLNMACDFLREEAQRDPLAFPLEEFEVTTDTFTKDPYSDLKPGDDLPIEIAEDGGSLDTWCLDVIASPTTGEEFVCERPKHNPLFKHLMGDEEGHVVLAVWQNGVLQFEPYDELEDEEDE